MNDTDIGSVLQNFRKMKGISLRQLASETGITASMLSQIERDLVNPSINTLKVIAKALDVPMYKFFLGEHVNENPVVRKGARITLGRPEVNDMVYELLTPTVNDKIECCMMHVPPKNDSCKVESMHEGDEVAYVVRGQITVFINDIPYDLHAGDSVMISAGNIHRWQNEQDEVAAVLFVVVPALF